MRFAGAAVVLWLALRLPLGLAVRPAFELARIAGAFTSDGSLATKEVLTIEGVWVCLSILNTLIA